MADLTEMVYIKIDKELKRDIDAYRRQIDPLPNRSEAIRQLILAGLAAKGHRPRD